LPFCAIFTYSRHLVFEEALLIWMIKAYHLEISLFVIMLQKSKRIRNMLKIEIRGAVLKVSPEKSRDRYKSCTYPCFFSV
jgi:hypothetical protein